MVTAVKNGRTLKHKKIKSCENIFSKKIVESTAQFSANSNEK